MMLKLKVLNPKGEVFISEEVTSVSLPTVDGVITVYPDHKPIISLLGVGEVLIELNNGTDESILISSGLVRVDKGSSVTIMADTAELTSEINLEAVEESRKKAQEYLKNQIDIPDAEFARIQAGIERDLMKIEVAKLRKQRGSSIKVKVTEVS
jgi:F-type H+-transporting ATPase subunit epsilon